MTIVRKCAHSTQLAVSLIALIALSTGAFGAEAKPIEVTLQWSLSLDAGGKIKSLTALSSNGAKAVADRLEPIIRHWRFTPASLNAVPTATETTLRVQAALDEAQGGDQYVVRVLSAVTGGRYEHGLAPEYPRAAMRMARYGQVSIEAHYDARGQVVFAEALRSSDRHVDSILTRTALAAVKQWTFKPEIVDGRGVPGSMVAPICFSLEGHEDPCSWTTPRGGIEKIEGESAFPTSSVINIDSSPSGRAP
jgi:TonB family protein